mmetsp:Transcript_13279/g.25462  ORF Transcript_13279/g.25462 Transcript_13279/m.25462 type:complete len:197 (-) Transcript_13279:263-853(-)|eukprot:CAMPEP_0114251390 /NCGR_PEP_ID=MMETSP0058-20121206/15244_1 /TAXON_ID=36894 /ORGANISM="Pyramimonas parkeae, CCMP726" /LENGTH=196 /DNA_ID=CAMNT_0001365187 /DNA_START=30 /DNA_END=620 /DNA_ORIENTATION=+
MAHSKGPHAGDSAKAKGLSKRKLKAATCWAYSKGKCKEPATCTKLHLGEVVVLTDEQKAAKAAKRKSERREKGKRKAESQEVEGAKKAAKKTHWLCPGCGNKNFGRRATCNGATCDTPRPENWKSLKDEDFVGPPLPVKKEKENPNKKKFSDGDDEDVEGPNVKEAKVKANKKVNTFSNHSDDEDDIEDEEESSDE